MDQDRWKKVNEIFHAALEVSTSERENFVSSASGGDPSLAAEVNDLLLADGNAGSYIESPLVESAFFHTAIASLTPALGPGDVLCGRFRIVRAVGEGGMGQVFEALDEELGVAVALKMIRPEIASNPEALARFRQEVRLARRITHPNVCRTFDIEHETRVVDRERGVTAEFVFLTMEFLGGETLAERIAHGGRLPLDLALDLARQVAEALHAAEALGVVHRDIKPANIMLVPAPANAHGIRAVISDFGLARGCNVDSLRSISGISNKDSPIGTLAYMAPEQLSGERVSPATDVYAFGLVLFEMATGKRAFPADTLLGGITQRLSGPPPDPSKQAPDLPDPWRRAIAGCLQVKPEERVSTAIDAIAVLEGQRTGSAIRTPGLKAAFRRWLNWRYAVAALLILCVAVSLFWTGFRFSGLEANGKVAAGALVYLAPVKNETGEKALDNVTELIQAGLAQSTQINLLDQGRVGDTLQRMTKPPDTVIDEPIAREIAMRNGAVRVVFATVTGTRGKYSLNVDVQQPDNTPTRFRDHWKKSFGWQSAPTANSTIIPQELLVAVRNADDWIRKEVGESANDIARLDAPPEDVTTGSWQALAAYSYAEELASRRKRPEAVNALYSAVKEDPTFALAYARLGDILVNLNRTEEGYRAYLESLDEIHSSRLSLRERDRIKGIYAQDTGDFQASEDAFREYTVYYVHDYLGWFYRAHALSMLGRVEDAIDSLKLAHQADPTRSGAVSELVGESLLEGDLPKAREWADQLRKMPDKDSSALADGVIAFSERDYEVASRNFQQVAQSSAPMFQLAGLRSLADLHAERGEFGEALADLHRASSVTPQNAAVLLDRAFVEGNLGDAKSMRTDLELALHVDDSPHTLIMASDILGIFISRAGKDQIESVKCLRNLDNALPRTKFGVNSEDAGLRVSGEQMLATGRVDKALAQFRKAAKLEPTVANRDYLGRALLAGAAKTKDKNRSRQFRNEAMAAFGTIALNPASVWHFPLAYPPGFYASELELWLQIAPDSGISDADLTKEVLILRNLRPHRSDALNVPPKGVFEESTSAKSR